MAHHISPLNSNSFHHYIFTYRYTLLFLSKRLLKAKDTPFEQQKLLLASFNHSTCHPSGTRILDSWKSDPVYDIVG